MPPRVRDAATGTKRTAGREKMTDVSATDSGPPWLGSSRGELHLHVWVQPGARVSELAGEHDGQLRIRVVAPASEGRANAELIRVVAAAVGVKRSRVTIARGAGSRRKTVAVAGVGRAELIERISAAVPG